MQNMFGTPRRAAHIYKNDNSGIGPKPAAGTQVKHEDRIFYHQHQAAHKYLSGKLLDGLTERFMRFLDEELASNGQIDDEEWSELPDLCVFARDLIFTAATKSLFGPYLLSLNPGFAEDFWQYVDAMPMLLKGVPRWMNPRAYKARDRVLDEIRKWHRFARQQSDVSPVGPNDADWDDYWGSKYLRVRQSFGQAIEGMDDEALAAEDLALLVA